MTTIKQRINITADKDVEKALKFIAKRDHMPVAAKATELIRIALDIEEDFSLAQAVEKRLTKKVSYISHVKAWK